MFSYICGRVAAADSNLLVVEAGGIGYELTATHDCVSALGKIGETVKVPTYLHVYEDGIGLYGFADAAEKSLFLKLISVSGIGPKMAVSMLSLGGKDALIGAIVTADVAALGKIKGVGKKTAERMIVELKDKLGAEYAFSPKTSIMPDITYDDDAVQALISLGYTRQEAVAAVARVSADNLSTEQIIMLALKG